MIRIALTLMVVLWASVGLCAEIAMINSYTYVKGLNEIGDIVGVYAVRSQSPVDQKMFTWVTVKGSVEEVSKLLDLETQKILDYQQTTKYRYRATTTDSKSVVIELKSYPASTVSVTK